MNKTELVEKVAASAKVSKNVAETVIEAALKAAIDALKKKNDVKIIGFGTLSVKKRKARTGVNPSNGKPVKIPACNAVSFKVSKALKAAVNK